MVFEVAVRGWTSGPVTGTGASWENAVRVGRFARWAASRAFDGRPCDLPGCASSVNPFVSFARSFSNLIFVQREEVVVSSADRAIGLDVHFEFCEVAVCENGQVRSVGRVETKPEAPEPLAASLLPTDRVVLEVMGASWEIVRILEPHVAKVIVVSPGDTGIAHARAKTDLLDARTLARLLWVGELDRAVREMLWHRE